MKCTFVEIIGGDDSRWRQTGHVVVEHSGKGREGKGKQVEVV